MQFNTHSSLPVNLVHRLWDRRNIPFYSNSVFLISHSGATAGIAFLFWVVATRSFSPEEVGISSALISAAALLSFFARFGMGDGIVRYLGSRKDDPSRLINSVFLATGAAAILVSVVFLVGLPVWSQPLRLVLGQPLIMAVFIISVIGLAGAGLIERVFVARRRGNYVLFFGVLLGLARLGALAGVLLVARQAGIITAWGLPAIVAAGIAIFVVLPLSIRGYRPKLRFHPGEMQDIGRFSLSTFVSSAWWQITISVLPLLILNMLGSAQSAFFFASWTIGSRLFTIPRSISTSLFAEGSYNENELVLTIRRGLRLSAVLLIPAVAFIIVLAKPLLLILGSAYMEQGHTLLWVVAISAPPFAVNSIYLGVVRVEKKQRALIAVPAAICILTLTISYLLLPRFGVLGAGIGFLVAQTAVSAVLLPSLLSRTKRPASRDSAVLVS